MEQIILTKEEWIKFLEILEIPPQPTEALRKLFKSDTAA